MDVATHTPQPILSPAEAWHLARWQLAEMLLLTPASELAATIQANLDASRDGFVGQAKLPATLIGSADRITAELQDGMPFPVAHWPTTDDEIRDTWGFVDMTDSGDVPFTMVAPFRPVSIANMPEGTQVIRIRDTRHSSTAALVEAMTCAKRDLTAALRSSAPEMAWRRANSVISVYRQAAKLVFRTLSEEDFNNWNPSAPGEIDITSAPALIAQIAATAKAQGVLAFQVIYAWTQAIVDSANQTQATPDAVIAQIDEALASMDESLSAFNKTLLLRSKIAPNTVQTMVVFRPHPHSIPVLLAIPVGASDTIRSLAPNR